MKGLLALALLAPIAGLFPVATTPPGEPVRPWLQGALLLAAGGWAAVLVDADPALVLGPVRPLPAAAAAAVAACLLVAAVERPATRGSVYAGGLAVGAVGAGLAADSMPLLLAGVAVGLIAAVAADEVPRLAAAVGAAGLAVLAIGVLGIHGAADRWDLPRRAVDDVAGSTLAALALGAALLIVAGGLRPRRTSAVLLAAGLAVATILVPVVRDADGATPLAVAAAVAALLTAGPGLPSRSLRPLPAPVPIGLLAVAAALGPGALLPAALLLAGGSALAAVLAAPAALVTALPGLAALAIGLADVGGTESAIVAALALAAMASLVDDARAGRAATAPGRPPAAAAIGLVVAAWLVVLPDTWGWVGDAGLAPYQEGAAAAVAAGTVVLVALGAGRRTLPAVRWDAVVAADGGPDVDAGDARR